MMTIYRCPDCGSDRIQFSFPVWIYANEQYGGFEDRSTWQPDYEAQPEKDSTKTWCQECDWHKLAVRDEPVCASCDQEIGDAPEIIAKGGSHYHRDDCPT